MVDQTAVVETPNPEASTEVPTGGQVAPETPTQESTSDAFNTLLASIKNPEGNQKYDSVETALKAVPHAQEHISNLEAELAEAREELTKRKTAEELVKQLEEQRTHGQQETPEATGIDSSQLAQYIDAHISNRESTSVAKANVQHVIDTMTAAMGDSAQSKYDSIAKDNNMSIDTLNTLAATSPAAVLRLAGLGDKPKTVPNPSTRGTVNTEALEAAAPVEGKSARLPITGSTTSDMMQAWRNAKPE